ncbi:MAG: FAD-binding protein [Deltaproteobacteria bacterium]|nr:FAD-binding protein [Deltaproteobacteria bacterium]
MKKNSQFEAALRRELEGKVHFDSFSRQLYATDASMYRFEPLAVVIPKNREDVVKTVGLCREYGISITARGAGTSLAGQAVGRGVQLDFSRYLDRVVEINHEQKWVRVEPGVVLDNLNLKLAPFGLQFAADVATGSRATIGGMVNNNSSGARSVIHGMTGDQVIELDVVLSDASRCRLGPVSDRALDEKCRLQTLEGRLYCEIPALAQGLAQEIRERFPTVRRRVSGYNLDAFIDPSAPVDLSRMLCGSEGTLALVLEAKLKLTPLAPHQALVLVECSEIFSAAALVPEILEHAPSAIELVDKLILDQTRASISLGPARALLKSDPGAVLVVEFCADSLDELKSRVDRLADCLRKPSASGCLTPLFDRIDQDRFWALRKAGVGLLMGIKGDAKPYAFVEDTAVEPSKLEAYLRRFHAIVTAHGTAAGWYGHASVGCLHIRPIVDLKSAAGRETLRSILDDISELVGEFGGSLSGEHGDGVVRGAYLEKMFGSRLYGAFRRVKHLFDPDGRFNPGKKVDTPDPLDNLRVLSRVEDIPELSTRFDYAEQGGFYRAVEMCSGVGECRKTLKGSMCPSYRATREEAYATRGRANALRAALEGRLEGGITNPQLYQALDLCLACKACKSECPSSVDMARFKAEFLHQYHTKQGVTTRAWITGRMDLVLRLLSPFALFINYAARQPLIRLLIEKLMGFDRRRLLPRFAPKSFRSNFYRQGSKRLAAQNKQVILFTDCWTNYNEPEIGSAAVTVLKAAGYGVELAKTRCCGRPAISQGQLERAAALARHNIAILYPRVKAGSVVVGIEPSCLLTIRDEYLALLGGEEKKRARRVADSSLLIDEFLAGLPRESWDAIRWKTAPQTLLVHAHCHQKALVGNDSLESLLARIPGLEVQMIDSGCCGMAGAFGYEVEHYAVSQACFDQDLASVLKAADQSQMVLAAGFSCRRQIEHFTGRQPKHPVEFLAGLLTHR